MPILLFTLTPGGVNYIHDILACLAKFDEDVSLEATTSQVGRRFHTHCQVLNLQASNLELKHFSNGSCCICAHGQPIFSKIPLCARFQGLLNVDTLDICSELSQALSSVFLRKFAGNRENDVSLERCEFELSAQANQPECRLIFRLICHSGIVKTYRLTYETGEVLHATFDKSTSPNTWTVSAKTLGDVVEHFGPKTEQLDWYLQDGKVTFTSYTEKIQNGREILKQPMHTSVALERQDFSECVLEQGLHIGIVVKDFRAVVAHAESINVNVTARYSMGNRPMQISYSHAGMLSEFTLMTRGSPSTLSGSYVAPARDLSMRPTSQAQPSHSASPAPTTQRVAEMAPPNQRNPLKRQLTDSEEGPEKTQSPPPPTASINPDSLFIPAEDDDQQWDEPNYEDDTDIVTWDNATEPADPAFSMRRIQDSASFGNTRDLPTERVFEIAPTQRLSQVKGMFD